ncbi:MAG: DNA primase [Rhodobacteraceae bacterium]|nr:DNA primase [Paracoccaceae bacterium]
MSFNDEFLDEIRTRLPVSSVVGRRVKLIRRGREYVGLSPFSNEKTPSFTVNDQKGFYHCFSSGEHGDIFTFVMKTQNLSFPEAVERLAEDAGLEMPRRSPEESEEAARLAKLREAVEAACHFFQRALEKPEGRAAADYLRSRGLSAETIKQFRLGYAPAGNALKKEFTQRGIPEDVMLEARLISEGRDGRESFDFFRDRVMFPILDARGRPIAFGGRVMGDGEPKYLNSPDTPLFHKGRLLYGLSLARSAALDKKQIIVCEGYMDVIALAQAGFANAVAPLGTALTEHQLDLLWKIVPEPVMCFDGDKAGQRAAARAASLALPRLKPGHSLQFALLPGGQDPDDLVRHGGPKAFETILAEALPLSEVTWRELTATHATDTPERRAGFERAVFERVSTIADVSVRDQYRTLFKSRLDALRDPGAAAGRGRTGSWQGASAGRGRFAKGGRFRGPNWSAPAPGAPGVLARSTSAVAADPTRERILMAVLINHPGVLGHVEDRLGAINFADSRLDSLRQTALMHFAQQPDIDSQSLKAHLAGQGFGRELDSLLSADTYIHAAFAKPDASPEAATRGWDHTFTTYQRAGLERELRRAQDELERNPTEAAFAAYQSLAEQLGRAGDDADADGAH